MFFLFSEEWTKFRREEFQQQKVPTDAFLRGDFSQLLGPNQFFNTPKYIQGSAFLEPVMLRDQCGCFPGNIIPANRLSPQGVALLKAYPRAQPWVNLAGTTGSYPRCVSTISERIPGAVDFCPSDAHYIRFRVQNYSLYHQDSNRGGTDIAPAALDRPNQTASINYIWTVSPNEG